MTDDRYADTLYGRLEAAGLPIAPSYRCQNCGREREAWAFHVVDDRAEWDGLDGRPGPFDVVCFVCLNVANGRAAETARKAEQENEE